MRSNKKFVVEANFIQATSNLELSLNEFLLLLYFENADDLIIDFNLMEKKLKITREKILEAFNNLLSKNLITLKSEKNADGRIFDKVSIDNFYAVINEFNKNVKEEELKADIFSTFEKEFQRPLSGMEFEIIKAWIEKKYSEDMILLALKEAVYNGAVNIRYVDTVLHDWAKKGFQSKDDVENYMSNKYDNKKLEETNMFEFNWLDDYDN